HHRLLEPRRRQRRAEQLLARAAARLMTPGATSAVDSLAEGDRLFGPERRARRRRAGARRRSTRARRRRRRRLQRRLSAFHGFAAVARRKSVARQDAPPERAAWLPDARHRALASDEVAARIGRRRLRIEREHPEIPGLRLLVIEGHVSADA